MSSEPKEVKRDWGASSQIDLTFIEAWEIRAFALQAGIEQCNGVACSSALHKLNLALDNPWPLEEDQDDV
jgi:hypothetical protein